MSVPPLTKLYTDASTASEISRSHQMPNPSQMQRGAALDHNILSHQPHAYSKTQWNVRDAVQIMREVLPTSNLTYEALQDVSVAYLSYEKRSIINYLRRNPAIFAQVRSLSTQSGITLPEWYSRINVDDLQRQATVNQRTTQQAYNDRLLQVFSARQADRQMQELFQTLRRLLPEYAPQTLTPQTGVNTAQPPQYLPVSALVNLAQNPGLINQLPLGPGQREQLRTLLSPTVLNLIQAQARTQQMMLSPDFIRILTSLLFNPMMHRPGASMPLAAFEKSEQEEVQGNSRPDEDLEQQIAPVESSEVIETQSANQMHEPHDPTEMIFQRIELSAQQIRELCRHLKANGGITLEELQDYQPQNEEEEELLRYLRQFNIFHAIADLNGRDETLDPSDIRRAVEDGSLILDEEHIQLVFTP